MEKVSKAEALRLLGRAKSVTVTRMWRHVDGNIWNEKDIPMRMGEVRYVDRVASRYVVVSGANYIGSRIDVMDADEVWYYEQPQEQRPHTGPFVRLYWSNVAIEYALGNN